MSHSRTMDSGSVSRADTSVPTATTTSSTCSAAAMTGRHSKRFRTLHARKRSPPAWLGRGLCLLCNVTSKTCDRGKHAYRERAREVVLATSSVRVNRPVNPLYGELTHSTCTGWPRCHVTLLFSESRTFIVWAGQRLCVLIGVAPHEHLRTVRWCEGLRPE